jgi:hypothetical protein
VLRICAFQKGTHTWPQPTEVRALGLFLTFNPIISPPELLFLRKQFNKIETMDV